MFEIFIGSNFKLTTKGIDKEPSVFILDSTMVCFFYAFMRFYIKRAVMY